MFQYRDKQVKRKGRIVLAGAFLAGIVLGCIGCGKDSDAVLLTGTGDIQTNQIPYEEKSVTEIDAGNAAGESLPVEQEKEEEMRGYTSVQDFSYELVRQNLDQTNPILSPVSVYLAVGLAGAGAEGETLREFEETMGTDMQVLARDLMGRLPMDSPSTEKQSMERLSAEDLSIVNVPADIRGVEVSIANSAWVDDGMMPDENWINTAKDYYRAEVFKTILSTEDTRKEINKWAEDKTNGLIREFLAQPLEVDTKLVLLDAVYFKGDWMYPFEAIDTREREFTTADGAVVMTDMMHKYGEELSYIENGIAQGVVLPYAGEKVSFAALKPVGDMTVREMYEQLSLEDITSLIEQKQETNVNLQLPKFEITFDRILNQNLIDMGLETAFDPERADFSGIGTTFDGESLYISLVRQKAVIRVDEEGTEAAAVTEVVMDECSALIMDEPKELYFDEPFLYMIFNNETNVPLFMGILDDPSDVQ